ncbi:hypothetical protein D9M71_573320 [compost metagenome]
MPVNGFELLGVIAKDQHSRNYCRQYPLVFWVAVVVVTAIWNQSPYRVVAEVHSNRCILCTLDYRRVVLLHVLERTVQMAKRRKEISGLFLRQASRINHPRDGNSTQAVLLV